MQTLQNNTKWQNNTKQFKTILNDATQYKTILNNTKEFKTMLISTKWYKNPWQYKQYKTKNNTKTIQKRLKNIRKHYKIIQKI